MNMRGMWHLLYHTPVKHPQQSSLLLWAHEELAQARTAIRCHTCLWKFSCWPCTSTALSAWHIPTVLGGHKAPGPHEHRNCGMPEMPLTQAALSVRAREHNATQQSNVLMRPRRPCGRSGAERNVVDLYTKLPQQ